jgi:alpha-L-rhamnosidase
MTPYGLTTEQRTEPLGLDEPRPRLSWKLRSDRRGAAQTAYRITATAADSARLIWDSGRRESGETLLIEWDGPALRPATRYHWRVEVWDETGRLSGDARSWFETGLLHRDEWTARWIGRDPVNLPVVGPASTPPPTASTSLPSTANASATSNSPPAGPSTTGGCTIRPTT